MRRGVAPVLCSALACLLFAVHTASASDAFDAFDASDALGAKIADAAAAEAECVAAVNEGQKFAPRHVAQAMRRSWWACTRRMIESSAAAGVDVRNEFELESRSIMREIGALKAALESSKPIQSIPTSFQWAQSGSELFINAKFAHKLDAPATLDVAADNVTLTATSLIMRASKDSKRFTLDLDFFDEIDPEASTWSFASVGRITFTIKKKDSPTAWPRLLKSKQKLANMHHWWEMAERYEDELEEIREEQQRQTKSKKAAADVSADGNDATNTATAEPPTNPAPAPKKELTEQQKKIKAIDKELKAAIQGLEEDLRSKKKNLEAEMRSDRAVLEQTFEKTKAKLEAEAEAKKKELSAASEGGASGEL